MTTTDRFAEALVYLPWTQKVAAETDLLFREFTEFTKQNAPQSLFAGIRGVSPR
jgi:hypothetical protein